ncbi:tumor necrosis factor receptor superfamily member 5-like [Halichoeres trimaculatus]|uniref:tumor necrosis factor receptor superfamily member 5-like n=1 Tax=Halichoeres trimaculatus TaxID=147232 RepID=UPI003D9E7B7C
MTKKATPHWKPGVLTALSGASEWGLRVGPQSGASEWGLRTLLMNILCGQTLSCGPYQHQIGDRCCPLCPPGSRVSEDCTESRSTHCLLCPEGTFMDQLTYRRRCYSCTNCDTAAGLKTKASCSQRSDSVCEPLEGFFCTEPAEDDCLSAQRHRSCDPGHYISQRGTPVSDAVCSPCPAGTFSDGTFTSCRPHQQCDPLNQRLKAAGTESQDATCGGLSSGIIALAVTVFVLAGFVFIMCAVVYHYREIHEGWLPQDTNELRGNTAL